MQVQEGFLSRIQPESREALQRLLAYRNNDVIERYRLDHGVEQEDAERAFKAFLQFMAVCGFKGGRSTATEETDGIWHAFLLHTRQYAEFCDRYMAGEFVHHEPTSDDASPHYYDDTRAFAAQIFTDLDERSWPLVSSRARCISSDRSPHVRFH